jgi:hypothetical protein
VLRLADELQVGLRRPLERPRKTWGCIQKDMDNLKLEDGMAQDRGSAEDSSEHPAP